MKISYTLFCRLRPYWVIIPSTKDRETCLCRIHENLAFIAQKLKAYKLLPSSDVSEMADSLACDKTSKSCMYGHCVDCQKNKYPTLESGEEIDEVEYWQWVSEKRNRVTQSGDVKEQRITKKEILTSRLIDLVDEFQTQLRRIQRHLSNVRQQFAALCTLKEKLTEDEARFSRKLSV